MDTLRGYSKMILPCFAGQNIFGFTATLRSLLSSNSILEAAAGFEPANSSFANCGLGPLDDAANLNSLNALYKYSKKNQPAKG